MSDAMLYEDGIMFDSDDPDFIDDDLDKNESSVSNHYYSDDCLQAKMSCEIIQSNSLNTFSYTSNWLDRSESVESLDSRFDSVFGAPDPDRHYIDHHHPHLTHSDSINTLERIKSFYNSCASCGVSWSDKHVSLDCRECGGYSLSRPCPLCDGKCQAVWRRDISMSHNVGKAHWEGECTLDSKDRPSVPSFLAEDILIRGIEELSTSS